MMWSALPFFNLALSFLISYKYNYIKLLSVNSAFFVFFCSLFEHFLWKEMYLHFKFFSYLLVNKLKSFLKNEAKGLVTDTVTIKIKQLQLKSWCLQFLDFLLKIFLTALLVISSKIGLNWFKIFINYLQCHLREEILLYKEERSE